MRCPNCRTIEPGTWLTFGNREDIQNDNPEVDAWTQFREEMRSTFELMRPLYNAYIMNSRQARVQGHNPGLFSKDTLAHRALTASAPSQGLPNPEGLIEQVQVPRTIRLFGQNLVSWVPPAPTKTLCDYLGTPSQQNVEVVSELVGLSSDGKPHPIRGKGHLILDGGSPPLKLARHKGPNDGVPIVHHVLGEGSSSRATNQDDANKENPSPNIK